MATELVPDLRAAADSAAKSRDERRHIAALHLVLHSTVLGGQRYWIEPNQALAERAAMAALAESYEVEALRAAARGETDR